MLSNITLSFLGFINLFMIPMTGLKTYCERHKIKLALTSEVTYLYTLITVLNLPSTRILVNITEALVSTTIHIETTKYTVIALISCIILPYIMEVIENFVQVKIDISLRNLKKTKKQISITSKETNEK